MEADVYVSAKPGNVAPVGTARGIYVNGYASQRPTTGYYGIHIGSAGASNVGWTIAFVIGDNPNTRGIQIGASQVGGVNVSSQTLVFSARDAAGVSQLATQFASADGTMVIRGGTTNPAVQLQGASGAPMFTAGTTTGAVVAHAPIHQQAKNTFAPTTGQTVVMADNRAIALINVTGTLASLTYQLPTASVAYEGKIVTWAQRCTVTTLTVPATAGTVLDPPTTATPGKGFAWICSGAFWFRLY
jgi:hypothetical protein